MKGIFGGDNVQLVRFVVLFSRTLSVRQKFLQIGVATSLLVEWCNLEVGNDYFFPIFFYLLYFKRMCKSFSSGLVACGFTSATLCFLSILELYPLAPYPLTFLYYDNLFQPLIMTFCVGPHFVFGVSPLSFVVWNFPFFCSSFIVNQ